MGEQRKDFVIATRVPRGVLDEIESLAATEDRSKTQMLRVLIKKGLATYGQTATEIDTGSAGRGTRQNHKARVQSRGKGGNKGSSKADRQSVPVEAFGGGSEYPSTPEEIDPFQTSDPVPVPECRKCHWKLVLGRCMNTQCVIFNKEQ